MCTLDFKTPLMEAFTSEYTVESILSLYRGNITTPFDEKIVTLEGFYQQTGKQSYGGLYYDRVYDEDKVHSLTIIINEKYRSKITGGQYYKFNGYLNRSNRSSKDGTIQLTYRITRIIDHLDEHQFISKEEFDMVRKRFDKNAIDIQGHLLSLLRNDRVPRIHIVLGATSIVDEDYKSQLTSSNTFDITEERINLSNPNLVTDTLCHCDSSNDIDLLVCMRGGGSGLETFNNAKLAEKVVLFKTPFVTAIGHKEDITMVERMADRGFATPTAFGAFLNSVLLQYNGEVEELVQRDQNISDLGKKVRELEQNQKTSEAQNTRDKQQLETLYQERQKRDKKIIKWLAIVLLVIVVSITLYILR